MSFITEWLGRKSVELFGKSDPYTDAYMLCLYWGFQQPLSNDKKPHYLIRFLRILSTFSVFYCCIGFVIVAYQLRDDLEKSTRNLSFAILIFTLLLKVRLGSVKRQEIETTLMSLSHNLYQEDIEKSDENLALQKGGRRAFIKIFMMLGIFIVVAAILRAISNVMKKAVMLPVPFFELQFSVYIFVVDTFGLNYYLLWYLFHEMTTFGILIRIRENFVILQRNIVKGGDALAALGNTTICEEYSKTPAKIFAGKLINKWRQKRAFLFLRKNIKHHQEILKIIRKSDGLYWPPATINIISFGSVFVIAYYHFKLLAGTQPWPYPLTEILYALGSLFEVSTKCFCGNQVKCASETAANLLYATPWTEMDPKNRKILKLFQLALQRKFKFSEGHILGFDHKFLASFYQSMYGYVAFVQNMTKKG